MFFYIGPINKLFFQFRQHECTITYVKVGSYALNWNKFVNWKNKNKHIKFQLRAILVSFH